MHFLFTRPRSGFSPGLPIHRHGTLANLTGNMAKLAVLLLLAAATGALAQVGALQAHILSFGRRTSGGGPCGQDCAYSAVACAGVRWLKPMQQTHLQ